MVRASVAAFRSGGFTILEGLVVAAILAITVAIAAPSFVSTIAGNRMRSMASDLQGALLLARSEAVKRNAQVTVRGLGGVWSDGWEVVDANNNLLLAGEPRLGIEVAANVNELRFLRSGRYDGNVLVNFEFEDAKERATPKCLRVGRSGRPVIEAGPC